MSRNSKICNPHGAYLSVLRWLSGCSTIEDYSKSEIRQKLDYVHMNPVDEVPNMLIATRREARGSGELDTRLGRWWSIDPKANASESPYMSMGGNPLWNNDVLGDTTYRFNKSDGTYIGMEDLDQTGQKGSYGEMKTIGEGDNAQEVWDGEYFNFADPKGDSEDIRNGVINKLVFVSEEEIKGMMDDQGAFESGKLNFIKESLGTGDFDYTYSVLQNKYSDANFAWNTMKSNSIFLPKGDRTAHNMMNFGNFLWAATGYSVGFGYIQLMTGADLHSRISPRRNGYPSQPDSEDDQRSIRKGVYYAQQCDY